MKNQNEPKNVTRLGLAALGLALFGFTGAAPTPARVEERPVTVSVLVQSADATTAARLVEQVGGTVTHQLGIINAVAADLTPAEREKLRQLEGVHRLYGNQKARVTGKKSQSNGGGKGSQVYDTAYPTVVGANKNHELKEDGTGVTIAVVDTGIWNYSGIVQTPSGRDRLLRVYDAIGDSESRARFTADPSGHGSHITSVAVGSLVTDSGLYNGIAPGADIVSVRAFDDYGVGTYADVIRGIDWVVANMSRYGIRVMNLSFSAPPQSHYWDDPINQAVMAAWRAGIVVVASAGNTGPEPMTIGVPGNVPYVITVGAMTDNFTPADGSDDILATFSAAGPTVEGFVKPEVVAPGGHMLGLMHTNSMLPDTYPEFYEDARYFTMSGTSQAAALVSGIVALMLEEKPEASPDQIKYRLMASARPAVRPDGSLAYSVFQQGAGRVDAWRAVHYAMLGLGPPTAKANQGLDIDKDLAGIEHYGGRANQLSDGTYYLRGLEGDGFLWNDGYLWNDGFLWSDGYLWNDGFLWSDGYLWNDGFLWNDAQASGFLWNDAFTWSDGFLWNDGFLWSDIATIPAAVNVWVNQE